MDVQDGTSSRARTRKSLEQQIAEQEARLRELRRRARAEERKARTKRLIETGAVVESALGMECGEDERRALLAVLTMPMRLPDGSVTRLGDQIAVKMQDGMAAR